MSKSERLLALLQLLHQYRQPVKAQTLAEKLSVSQRTVYRDIDTLRLQGAKIQAVIPKQQQNRIQQNTLFTPLMSQPVDSEQMAVNATQVRQAIRDEKPLRIDYQDGEENKSQRTIYPFSLAFFDSVQVIGAWCKLRQDFRHFRVDRINRIKMLNQRYSPGREQLFREWQRQYNYCPDDC